MLSRMQAVKPFCVFSRVSGKGGGTLVKPEGWEVQQSLQEMEAWALAFPWPLGRAMVLDQTFNLSTPQHLHLPKRGTRAPSPSAAITITGHHTYKALSKVLGTEKTTCKECHRKQPPRSFPVLNLYESGPCVQVFTALIHLIPARLVFYVKAIVLTE